eukprot:scaffold1850_cov194-Pinguiococcus_pyrenoidosus.AAC.57
MNPLAPHQHIQHHPTTPAPHSPSTPRIRRIPLHTRGRAAEPFVARWPPGTGSGAQEKQEGKSRAANAPNALTFVARRPQSLSPTPEKRSTASLVCAEAAWRRTPSVSGRPSEKASKAYSGAHPPSSTDPCAHLGRGSTCAFGEILGRRLRFASRAPKRRTRPLRRGTRPAFPGTSSVSATSSEGGVLAWIRTGCAATSRQHAVC